MAFKLLEINFLLIGILISCIWVLWKLLWFGVRPKNYPPGPPTYPIVGNILQMARKNVHYKFQEWARQYGPIVCLKFGGQTMILMNDATVIRDLLEKRSSIYSARPDLYMREFSNDLNIAFRNNDDVWRRMRKMYHLRLNIKSTDQYVPYQHFDSLQLMNDLLETPNDFEKHVARYTVSIASTILYGWRTTSADKGYVKDLLGWIDEASAATNLQIVDFFPIFRPLMDIIPPALSSFKRKLLHIKELEGRLFMQLFEDAKAKVDAGKVYPSFIRDMILSKGEDALSDEEIAASAAHGFAAATDTQMNTLLGFIKAMLLYPDVQKKAREEIERVVGRSRMPEWSDRQNLPYVRACVEEALRWAPTTLTAAVPHAALRDDVYNGYHIPAGATMVINVWTLNNNSVENPREFNPDRYAPEITAVESNAISQDSPKRFHFTFGAGRRVCPGFHLAERGLFIAAVRVLWGFEFSRVKDENGCDIAIDRDAMTQGIIVKPEPYPCKITPLDAARAQIVRDKWHEAEAFLDSEGNYTEEFLRSLKVG